MQKAPVLKASGLAPVEDEPIHVFGSNLEQRVVESKGDENKSREQDEKDQESIKEDDVETIKRRKFDAITGEEEEETIFQGDFKLFAWCLDTSNWIEKGRGQLKLNDSVKTDENRSRLIMRTGGTYRIVLNVAIKHSFFKVISNTKTNIRFTDSLTVWAASGSNAGQLADLIKERLEEDAKSAPIERTKTPNDSNKSEARETETPTDVTKSTHKEEEKPAPGESESQSDTTNETADESTPPTDETDSPAKDGTPPSSDETKSPVDESDSTPAVRSKSPVKDTNDSDKSFTESKINDSKPSPEITKSAAAASNSSSRRHSGTSDESDENELGKKKIKHSSD